LFSSFCRHFPLAQGHRQSDRDHVAAISGRCCMNGVRLRLVGTCMSSRFFGGGVKSERFRTFKITAVFTAHSWASYRQVTVVRALKKRENGVSVIVISNT